MHNIISESAETLQWKLITITTITDYTDILEPH